MKNTKLLCSIILCMIFFIYSTLSFAKPSDGNAETLFNQANLAYSEKNYVDAISLYNQITNSWGYSASVLYNLANSYNQLGDNGRAILQYQRALLLSPHNSDTLDNLQMIRKENSIFPYETKWYHNLFTLLNIDQWSKILLLLTSLYTLYHITTIKYPLSRRFSILINCLTLLVATVCLGALLILLPTSNPSIILEKDSRLLVSPFHSANSIGKIREGRAVYPTKTHDNFSYVKDESGRKGWIQTDAFERLRK